MSDPYGTNPYGRPNPYGAGGAGAYGAPYGGQPAGPPKTDGVSVPCIITLQDGGKLDKKLP